jgi:plastocyanin
VPGTAKTRTLAKLGGLLVAVGLAAAACAPAGKPPSIELTRSGQLVEQVVDSTQDAGRFPSVAVDAKGNASVAYLVLFHILKKNEIPAPIVAGTIQPPAVVVASQTKSLWDRTSVTPQPSAGQDERGVAPELAGSQGQFKRGVNPALALDGQGKHHVAWSTPDGLFYSEDTAGSYTAPQKVVSGVTVGASIAVGSDGSPWIAFYQGPDLTPTVAQRQGTEWAAAPVGAGGPANKTALTTAIQVDSGGNPVVAFADGAGTAVATKSGTAWNVEAIPGPGGVGVSMALGASGSVTVAYYTDMGSIRLADSTGPGAWKVREIASTQTANRQPGPSLKWTTGVGLDGKGTHYVAWADTAINQIVLATDAGGKALSPQPVPNSHSGANPTLALSPSGQVALAWYDTANQNLQAATSPAGGLVIARSPQSITVPSGAPATSECEQPATTIKLVAKDIAFDKPCIAVAAGKPFTIDFDNQDAGTPHNVDIYTDSSAKTHLGGAKDATDTIAGPATTTYDISSLDPGNYYFQCDIHPTQMNGTLIVAK